MTPEEELELAQKIVRISKEKGIHLEKYPDKDLSTMLGLFVKMRYIDLKPDEKK